MRRIAQRVKSAAKARSREPSSRAPVRTSGEGEKNCAIPLANCEAAGRRKEKRCYSHAAKRAGPAKDTETPAEAESGEGSGRAGIRRSTCSAAAVA